ncbi:MAG: putative 2OG-Fe(II) oxygenase, partial [Aureliella sp.]
SSILTRLRQMQADQVHTIDSNVAVRAKSAQGLYESGFDLFQDVDPSLKLLIEFIENSLALAISLANNQEARPQDVAIEFVDSWYHITNQGGFHDAHVHHGCSWCGIYYLQLGSSGERGQHAAPNGGSRFYCPFNLGGGYRDFGNKYLSTSIDAPIQDGQLLLFPSYLMHSGLPYTGELDRVVIAFNARVKLRSQS